MDWWAQAFAAILRQKTAAAGLFALLLGALVYLPSLNNPPHPYWDEYYYLPAVQRHMEGTATYAPHPPLGFMLMTTGVVLSGANKTANHALAGFAKITDRDVPVGYDYRAIRLPAAIFAVLGSLLFYGLLLHLTGNALPALTFTTLFVFENAFVVQFRSAHLDAFQIAFVLAALLAWFHRSDAARTRRGYVVFGLWLGLAVMVKTNAAVLLALPAFALLHDLWQGRRDRRVWLRGAATSGAMLGCFAGVILAVFSLNIVLSPYAPDPNSEPGRKQLPYMGPAYQNYLNHRTGLTFAAWSQAITGYSAFMRDDFTGVTLNDRNSQDPVTWPFTTDPVAYRWDSDGIRTSYSFMLGNPVGWRLSLAGIFGALALIVLRRRRPSGPFGDPGLAPDFVRLKYLLAMFATFLAAHMYMGTFRVMYVYHHFIGLILGFMALALSFRIVVTAVPAITRHRNSILGTVCLCVALAFWFDAPLTYHRALTRAGCELRNIPTQVLHCVGKP